MERPKTRSDVAVFVDFENVYVSVREKFDATPNFEMIMDRCEDYGRIVIARAYADWYRYPRVTSALFANGVEPMYVPTYYYDREVGRTGRPIKNSVDIHLCIDVMRTLYTQTHLDKFVLVTGDRDFIPLVNAIRQHGKEVVIIGIGGAASAHLAQSADEFLFYEQIADLKSPQQRQEQQRQEQQQAKAERREREKTERAERERERGDGNGKVEARREREKTERPAPAPEVEAPAPQRSVYDTLVDAIQLARQRGFVSNLGSLKVLMRELDSGFNESKVKDSSGRPFSKFKDFVKEAERQGKVQIFTNGTVTEVFLPGEDPMRVSQFAEDLASQQAERELESELELEEALLAPEAPEMLDVVEHPYIVPEVVEIPGVVEPVEAEPQPVVAPIEEEVPVAEAPAQEQTTRPSFGEREWQIFRGSMSQFTDPVRFAEIFSALRGLRNQEIIDLTNNELKELVKQAINRGMLQRTGRGAKAYYRLSSQYRIARDNFYSEQPQTETAETQPRAEAAGQTAAEAPVVESAAGLVQEAGAAAAAPRRRRARTYSKQAQAAEASAEPAAETTAAPAPETIEPLAAESRAPQPAEDESEQPAQQKTEEPAAKPRRNRRKKPASAAAEAAQPAAPSSEAPAEPVTASADQPDGAADTDDARKATNGTKKRRSRRKKTTATGDEATAGEAESANE
ncbi:MAG TPA: NYN domain-containing protein [Herpetosiphonaceae bacterium]